MADIQQQLSRLLGRDVQQIRKTDENPSRISVIDVVAAITGQNKSNAAVAFKRLQRDHPAVTANSSDCKFPGERQRKTPVTDVRGIVEIIMLLPGHTAARVRRQVAELLVRYLGGDISLVDEVCAIRGYQEELAIRAPEDPRRLFGEAVEVSSSSSGPQLAQVLSTVYQRLTNQEKTLTAQGQLLARIHERLEQDRQRVNLNVRAPKRAAPH